MCLAPAVAWQTTSQGLPARTKMLTVAGLDVGAPVPGGNTYGVNPNTITVTEAAAGSVSKMTFTITDPQGQVAVNVMDPVIFWDIVRDQPIFRGWVATASSRQVGIGRKIEVSCIGPEAILDWAYVPSLTIPSGTEALVGLQIIASAAVGLNGVPLRWGMDPASFATSVIANPVDSQIGTGNPILSAYTVASSTLRQALRAYSEWMAGGSNIDPNGVDPSIFWISVDMWFGLRIWRYAPVQGTGWTIGFGDSESFITITPAGPIRPSATDFKVDAVSLPRTAVVTGSGGNVSIVGDGSGLPGPAVARTDTNATGAQARQAIGRKMLSAQSANSTGSTTVEGTLTLGSAVINQVRPGTPLLLTDTQAGVTPSPLYTFMLSISKTFAPSGEETWRIDFGNKTPRTATGLIRRLAQGDLA